MFETGWFEMERWGPAIPLFVRAAAFLSIAPFFSGPEIPMRVRGSVALGLAVLVLPDHQPASTPSGGLEWLILVVQEAFVGLILGGVARLLLLALELAGQLASQGLGLFLGQDIDPTTPGPAGVGPEMYRLFALMIFVTAGGHRRLLASFLEGYRVVPPGDATLSAALLPLGIRMGGDVFAVGLRLAAPVVVSMLLFDLILVLASRSAPLLPMLGIGMALKVGLGLMTLSWLVSGFASSGKAWLTQASRLVTHVGELLAWGASR